MISGVVLLQVHVRGLHNINSVCSNKFPTLFFSTTFNQPRRNEQGLVLNPTLPLFAALINYIVTAALK